MGSQTDKVALVTGGSRGIGRAIAAYLLDEAMTVVICGRNKDELDRTTEELSKAMRNPDPNRIIGEVCDVRDYEQVVSLYKFMASKFGGLDVLINNAGIGLFKTVEEMKVEDWHAVLETNLNSLFYFSHEAIPQMRARGGGYIFNIGSLAGKNAFPKGAAYNASKFGLVGFSEALMEEVRHDNIRVSYIMPGSVKTSFGGSAEKDEDNWKLTPEDVAQVVIDLLNNNPRSLPSRVEIRPSRPPRKK